VLQQAYSSVLRIAYGCSHCYTVWIYFAKAAVLNKKMEEKKATTCIYKQWRQRFNNIMGHWLPIKLSQIGWVGVAQRWWSENAIVGLAKVTGEDEIMTLSNLHVVVDTAMWFIWEFCAVISIPRETGRFHDSDKRCSSRVPNVPPFTFYRASICEKKTSTAWHSWGAKIVNIANKTGESTEPCLTPKVTVAIIDLISLRKLVP